MKFLKSSINVILLIVIAITFILSIVLGMLHFQLTKSSTYINNLSNSNYEKTVYDSIKKSIKNNSSIIDLNADELFSSINKDNLNSYINDYSTYITNVIIKNDKASFNDSYGKSYNFPEVYTYIKNSFSTYADENVKNSSEDFVQDAYDKVSYIIKSHVEFMPLSLFQFSKKLMNNKILSFTGNKYNLDSFYNFLNYSSKLFYISLILLLISILLFIFINRKRFIKAFYKLSSLLFVCALAIFVQSIVNHYYDISSKLSIGDSPLSKYLTVVIHTFEKVQLTYGLIAFSITLIMFVISFILLVRKNIKKVT